LDDFTTKDLLAQFGSEAFADARILDLVAAIDGFAEVSLQEMLW